MLPPVFAHTQTLYTLSTHGSFQTSSGASLKARLQHLGSENTHTRCFHLCLSSDRMSQCLGRKMGLCRAQRLESPKATHQIQLLQSVIPCRASHHSSHFKLHSLSPTSQLWTDGFLFLLHGMPSLKALPLFFLFHLGSSALSFISCLFSFSCILLFVCYWYYCNTSLTVFSTD